MQTHYVSRVIKLFCQCYRWCCVDTKLMLRRLNILDSVMAFYNTVEIEMVSMIILISIGTSEA